MDSLTRQEVLDVLQGDWAEYIQKFHSLSLETQSVFLRQQGYARFADLLAHIVAWWKVGFQSVERYLNDPASQPIKYDVDAINAEAIARASKFDEAQVVTSFEKMRCFLIDFVKVLPDSAFENEKVANQLKMELVGHLSEHKIAASE